MRWSDGSQIGCRLCLNVIESNHQARCLFDHQTDKPRWTHFLLHAMALRLPGNCQPVPQHLCKSCHLDLCVAFGAYKMAQISTKTLQQKHEMRDEQLRQASRNGDGAAGLRAVGKKTYFAEDRLSDDIDVNGLELADLARACVEDDAEDAAAFERDGESSMQIAHTENEPTPRMHLQSSVLASTESSSEHLHVVLREDLLFQLRKSASTMQTTMDTNFASNRLQDTNRGFQMLQRNGWKPGETLGRNGEGIDEPIA